MVVVGDGQDGWARYASEACGNYTYIKVIEILGPLLLDCLGIVAKLLVIVGFH